MFWIMAGYMCVFFLLVAFPTVQSLTIGKYRIIAYVPSVCGTTISVSDSVQVESSSGLTYANNVNCNFTVTVSSPYLVLANLEKFELEPLRSGSCSDYVNLYDGGDTSSTALHSSPLCGTSLTNTTYVTAGQQMTVHFVTDSTAVYLGFYIVFTAATAAPCSGTQFTCNNSFCIPSTLACDNYDQCGDASDESGCTNTSSSSSEEQTTLIVGLTLGFVALLLIGAYIAYRVYRRNQWRRFHNDHIHDDDLPDPDPSYPVTHKYFRGIRGHPGLTSTETMGASDPAIMKSVEDLKGDQQC
ncbi:hypothetical protein BaRGS_00016538 [Batillaria attramentaria]|uniref:CUB domain-containing protein n=1 Tax=Batillaria attramentaria TaxID=370345 RepID=A0ABD0KYS7_9CAEN